MVQGGSSLLQALKQLLSTRTLHAPKKSSKTRNQAATRPCDQWRGRSLEQEQKPGQGGLKWFSKEKFAGLGNTIRQGKFWARPRSISPHLLLWPQGF